MTAKSRTPYLLLDPEAPLGTTVEGVLLALALVLDDEEEAVDEGVVAVVRVVEELLPEAVDETEDEAVADALLEVVVVVDSWKTPPEEEDLTLDVVELAEDELDALELEPEPVLALPPEQVPLDLMDCHVPVMSP